MTEPTPWLRWLTAAFAAGLTPAQFWRLSLKEWRALIGADSVLARGEFEALSARFPDNQS